MKTFEISEEAAYMVRNFIDFEPSSNLNSKDVHVLRFLTFFLDDQGKPIFPTVEGIAKFTLISPSGVSRCLAKLEVMKLIIAHEVNDQGEK